MVRNLPHLDPTRFIAFTGDENETDMEKSERLRSAVKPYPGQVSIRYINSVGWPPAGVLTNRLLQAGYYYNQAQDKTIIRVHCERVASALAVLMFEQ